MSIGLLNRDSSFFEVEVKDSTQTFQSINDDIISFSIDEEIGKILSGSLVLRDPYHVYSRNMKIGTQLICTWGYKTPDILGSSLVNSGNLVVGCGYRQKVTGYVQSPSGGGANNGQITYNINFYGSEIYGGASQKQHKADNKAIVVSDVLDSLGVKFENQFINFYRGSEKCTATTYPIQFENDYAFLVRCAREWNAIFKIGQDSKGNLLGMFTEFDTDEMKAFTTKCSGSTIGNTVELNYKGDYTKGVAYVKEYSWQNRMGLDGTGDNVQIVMVNGQPQFHRYIAETQTVETWKLNPEKITKALAEKSNVTDKTALMSDWLKAKTFKEVEWAFTKGADTTAPQGAGYTMSVKIIGNAHITAGTQVIFGSRADGGGFPDFCTPEKGKEKTKWWVMKAKHNVDGSGYNMDLEIVDSFTLNNGSMVG